MDWNGLLNSDDVNTEAPLQTIWISGKRQYLDPWVNKGIEPAARKIENYIKKTLNVASTAEDVTPYKRHRNMLN